MKCPHCGREHPNQARICPLTGSDILSYACPRCGEEVQAGADVCPHCNLPLNPRAASMDAGSTDRVRVGRSRLWLHLGALVVGLALLITGVFLIFRVFTSASEEIASKTPIPNSVRTAWVTLVFDSTATPVLPTPLAPSATRTPIPTATPGPSPTPTDLVAPVYTQSAGNPPPLLPADQRQSAGAARPAERVDLAGDQVSARVIESLGKFFAVMASLMISLRSG